MQASSTDDPSGPLADGDRSPAASARQDDRDKARIPGHVCFAAALLATFRDGWYSTLAAGLIGLDGLGRIGAGVFACDPGCGGSPRTRNCTTCSLLSASHQVSWLQSHGASLFIGVVGLS